MDLKWPILLLPVAIAAGAMLWLAFRRSQYGWQGKLPYLARSFRLTELPEYRRAIRLRNRLSVAALVLSIVAVTTLVGATLRPTRSYHPPHPGSDTPHVDIMLCIGPLFGLQFADETGLVPLLTTLRDNIATFVNQRVGMTHEFYRNFPVTADHQSVLERMDTIISTAKAYTDIKAKHSYGYSSVNTDSYERETYGSAANVVDTLATCAMGLPSVGSDNGRGKMIVFIGGTEVDGDPEAPSSGSADQVIYNKDTLGQIMKDARIQVNAIVPRKVPGPIGFVEKLIADTGGQQIQYTEVDDIEAKRTVRHLENQQEEFNRAVAAILAKPPASQLDAVQRDASRPFRWDVPDILLQIALIAAVGVAACRLGMRL
jgi:hypothetical protein